jgi:hypothetical protein
MKCLNAIDQQQLEQLPRFVVYARRAGGVAGVDEVRRTSEWPVALEAARTAAKTAKKGAEVMDAGQPTRTLPVYACSRLGGEAFAKGYTAQAPAAAESLQLRPAGGGR